jgi:hypothetical protein
VIKAKYDAGLLKPYDYIKGYERMNKWMDSGRAAPKADSIQGSAPSSPQKGAAAFGRARLVGASRETRVYAPNPICRLTDSCHSEQLRS